MKSVLILSSLLSVVFAGVLKDPSISNNNYIYFSGDGDGKVHLVDLSEAADEAAINDYVSNPHSNGYWLYTRNNPTSEQVLYWENVESVLQSHFEFNKITVVLVHGWTLNGHSSMNTMLTEALLQVSDVNVIVLDWGGLAGQNYITSRNGVPAVGTRLGEFVRWLTTLGASYERIHLIGFSLGGHIVGLAGRVNDGQIKRITGLDPAGPGFNNSSDRIVETDARYVEIIHTNTGLFGYPDICGHVDHFPNGGTGMPGCSFNTCSHNRAYELMTSTIKYNNLHANQCETLTDAIEDRCTGNLYPMGNDDINKTGSGIFRVNTGSSYPY